MIPLTLQEAQIRSFLFAAAMCVNACSPVTTEGDGGVDGGAAAGGTTAGGSTAGGTTAGGTTAGGTTAGGTTAGGTTAGGLSDEFADPATASNWSDLFPARHLVLDINTSFAGWLTLVPTAQNFNGWYSEYEGPLYFKTLTGDFVVETSVVIGSASDRTMLPALMNSFVQAGFVIRDPSSQQFRQRWIMYNLGYQDIAVAREIKTTIPNANQTTDSLSTLYLNNVTGSLNHGRLRVCRLGSTFRFFHQHPPSTAWTEEVFRSTGVATRVNGNGPRPARPDNSALSFDRPDLPAALQVGLYAGNYAPPVMGVRAEFDFFRVGAVSSAADCLQPL